MARIHELRSAALAIGCVVVSTACAHAVRPYAQLADLAMIHLLATVLISALASVRVSLFACLVSVLLFDFFFIPPHFAFAWTDAKSGLIFVAMFVVTAVVSSLTERLRHQEQLARAAAFRAGALYELNVELSLVSDPKQLAAVTERHLEQLFGARAVVLRRTREGAFEGAATAREQELAQQAWVRREFLRHEGGPSASSVWLPLPGNRAPAGVIGLTMTTLFDKDSEPGLLLFACANQFATALERIELALAVHRTELETETERLRNSLLSAVSHDLKTPLASMIAAGTTLMNQKHELDAEAAHGLLSTIVGEGERLTRLIQNLLSISRLESPTIELRRTPEAVEEIVSVAVGRVNTRFGSRVRIDVEDDLPLISAEPLLLEQVLINLLDNASRYAGPEATIYVHAHAGDHYVTLHVADDGPGIPEGERHKVFEKFYRGRHAGLGDGGAGLGLTICRAIVRAHGGRIVARARMGGGTLIEFTLPLFPAPAPYREELALAREGTEAS